MSDESKGTSDRDALKGAVIDALRTIFDPEIPVNIHDLGLIYDVEVSPDGHVRIRMTLTTPNCPVAETMPGQVKQKAESVEGVSGATVDLVWDPPWSGERMSEDARLQLEMMGISWAEPHVGGAPGPTSLTIGRTGPRKPDRRSS